MYKSIIERLTDYQTDEESILLDDFTFGYSEKFKENTGKRKFVRLSNSLFKLIENCHYTNSDDNDAFFKHFILNLIICKIPVKSPKRFLRILVKTNNLTFFKELLGLSFSSDNFNFSVFSGELSKIDSYEYLNLDEQRKFISLLKELELDDCTICDYITFFYLLNLSYGIKMSKLPSFIQRYSDRIFIHFVDECEEQEDIPLIHDLFGSNTITVEYENSIYRVPVEEYELNKDQIINIFLSYFPDYIGVIRIWKSLEDYFNQQNRSFHVLNFSDLDPEDFYNMTY